MQKNIALLILVFKTCFIMPLFGAASEQIIELDLSGDGKKEKVVVVIAPENEESEQKIRVTLGKQSLLIDVLLDGYYEEPQVSITEVTPDAGKKRRWLQISAEGPNDWFYNIFITLREGKLQHSPIISGRGEVTLPGVNTVIQKKWYGFWFNTIKYNINKDDSLSRLYPELSFIGYIGNAQRSFPIYTDRQRSNVLAQVPVGSTVEVLLFYRFEQTEDDDMFHKNDAFLIKLENGLTGWLPYDTEDFESLIDIPWAG